MTEHTPKEILAEYDALTNRFEAGGGYEIDTETDKICNGLAIPQSQREQLFSSLSGGEKTRVNLARLLLEKTYILLLDEPTNHLDLASREWVEDALEEYEGALLFVSHDRYFVDKFATRIWELENQTIRDFPCGYEKYRSIKAFEAMQAAPAAKEKREKKEKPRNTGGSKAMEKKIKALERDIEKQETLIAGLDEKITAASADYQELSRLMEEKQEEETKLSGMMDEWESLSLQLEESV